MKLVKVKIKKANPSIDPDKYVYPAAYSASEVHREGLYATGLNIASVSMSGELGRGGSEEFCIIALNDAIADSYALDPDMDIITEAVADTLMEQWRIDNGVSEDMVNDPDRIAAVNTKLQYNRDNPSNKLAITQEDRDALDPTTTTSGVIKSRKTVRETLGSLLDTIT